MRIANLALLAALALTACDQEPVFDTSTPATYQRSLAAITAKLGADDQHRLDIALLTFSAPADFAPAREISSSR